MRHLVKVYPANKQFKPHVWNSFDNKQLAEYYADQLRKTKQENDQRKNLYTKVEII